MNVLVAYASKHGSTAEIAKAVAEGLSKRGVPAEAAQVGTVESLKPYSAVVLGSAVYMKRWRGEARRFMHRHRDELVSRPFWIFSSGPVGPPDDEPDFEWLEPRKVLDEAERLHVRGHVVFGGSLPEHGGGLAARAMARSIPDEYHDRRDWAEVDAWAAQLADELDSPAGEAG